MDQEVVAVDLGEEEGVGEMLEVDPSSRLIQECRLERKRLSTKAAFCTSSVT